jgi:alpha-galactosidase
VVRVARSVTGDRALPALQRVPGLDPGRRYRVSLPLPGPLPRDAPPLFEALEGAGTDGAAADAAVVPGAALGSVGLRLPLLHAAQAVVLELTAQD